MPDYSTRAPGVYLEEVSGARPISGVGTALPAFLGLAPKGPTAPTLVTNWTQFQDAFGGISPGFALGRAVYSYMANGGSRAMIVRVSGAEDEGSVSASAVLTDEKGAPAVVATARRRGEAGNQITLEFSGAAPLPPAPAPEVDAEDATEDDAAVATEDEGPVARTTPAGSAGETSCDLAITGPGDLRETYTAETMDSLLQAATDSALVHLTAPEDGTVRRPSDGATTLQGGSSGAEVTADSFLGDEEQRTGLAALVVEDEITMLAAPDLVTSLAAGAMSADAVTAVQRAMIDHCEMLHDRLVILDPPLFADPGSAGVPMTAQQYLTWRDTIPSSMYAALYVPWTEVLDRESGRTVAEPPSGFVAGAWARNDVENGVSHAPVGRLRNALNLTRQFTDAEQGLLNPRGINCLRVFRGKGPVIYGARTLSDDSEWKYLNVRRLFNYIEESVMEGTQYAVFAPNDTDLWARLRRSIRAFLLTLWRDGALVGTTPEEAFYVKCDGETNPVEQVDQGVVTVEIGAAPVKPAEFVVIRVRQSSSGSAVSE